MSNIVHEDQLREIIRGFLSNEVEVDDSNSEAQQINEFSFSGLMGDLPKATTDAFKQYLLESLFGYLESAGFPITKTSVIGRSIVNTVEEMDWLQIGKYFTSETACAEVTTSILEGVQESFQEMGYDALIQVMFGVEGARLQGMLGSPFRELVNEQFRQMTEPLRQPIIEFLCGHRDVEKFMGDMKKQIPAGGAIGSAKKDEFTPMIFKK